MRNPRRVSVSNNRQQHPTPDTPEVKHMGYVAVTAGTSTEYRMCDVDGNENEGWKNAATNLINQEPLSFRRIIHFLRIFRNQRVEKRIKTFIVPPFRT